MPLLVRLRERLFGDTRTEQTIEDVKQLYGRAEDPEAFHAALAEGDIERATSHSALSEAEIHSCLDRLYTAGIELADTEKRSLPTRSPSPALKGRSSQ